MPPRMTAPATVRQMNASSAKPIRLSENRENPALLNADTEWNRPR
jgi:hypothetical protein